jgi:hypothetical protein
MEWSNSLARVLNPHKAGDKVTCIFSDERWGPRTALRKSPEGDPDETDDSEETENREYQVKTIERQFSCRKDRRPYRPQAAKNQASW